MKKVALVFVLAVLLPSLVLAWLAVRSLSYQQVLLERQQSLLYQHVTDSLAQDISDYLGQRQQEFSAQVESLAANRDVQTVAAQFDDQIRQTWPLAEVGFCVTTSGKILSPPPNARPEAQTFYLDNSGFLGNREIVEVYQTVNNVNFNGGSLAGKGNYNSGRNGASQSLAVLNGPTTNVPAQNANTLEANGLASGQTLDTRQIAAAQPQEKMQQETGSQMLQAARQQDQLQSESGAQSAQSAVPSEPQQNVINYKQQLRNVIPQSQIYQIPAQAGKPQGGADDSQNNLSRVIPAQAEFAQLVGDGTDGMLARFLQNKLKLMFWHRLSAEPNMIFGAQLDLNRVVDGLRGLIQPDPALQNEICLALLDDNAKPVALSRAGFQASWKRPFVATEIGDALPHWEVAAYLVNPEQLKRVAHTTELTLGLLIAMLVLAIGVGSWLIVRSLGAELKLARQKTDFVSNVSHELKTPLTSIRMFSELLAEGRVADDTKRRSYLQIITAEAARLTRLINNVLDFSRMERGEKKYNFQPCDLAGVVRGIEETFRPHLEAAGFKFVCELPGAPISVRGDADALSQIIVNLLSNAEKYSNGGKEIILQAAQKQSPLPHAEIKVLDRGPGVPRGSEEKVFEKFYRAHDSLSSGIQGSGLGLTIARQIARAHGGDVVYEPREGGGSCFILRLPVKSA